jgi:FAD/FMN-containing dehydrogenase
MTSTVQSAQALRATLSGPVFTQFDDGYDEARRVWNADIDRRPAVIARCTSAADVAAALAYAQDYGLEIAVRGGAHNLPGLSAVDGGLVVDLSGMRAVAVDPGARTARVQGGALLGDLDAATQQHGLAVPVGMVSHTGIGGLTLGGGMGWLTRLAGLSIDNLRSAEVVLADGRIVRADAEHEPDLFWALRGGGGNFGVVTEFEFGLHEVGPVISFGLFFWGLEQGAAALRYACDLVAELPPEFNVVTACFSAPPLPFVPEEHRFAPGVAMLVAGFGSPGQHAAVVKRIRAERPPLFDVVTPMPYTGLQQLIDEPNSWGHHYYEKSAYFADLDDEAADLVIAHLPERASPLSLAIIYRLDGAYSATGEQETAYTGRSPRFWLGAIANAPDPALLPADRQWARSLMEALRPKSMGDTTYVNAMYEADEARVLASYGPEKYERLARIKARYDPGNVFHRNVNIKPA